MKTNSNFGVLMDLFGITPQEISIAIDSDITLISKWRTGKRKLISGKKWSKRIVSYFIEKDCMIKESMIDPILKAFYDNSQLEAKREILLEKWLTYSGQISNVYIENRRIKLLEIFSQDTVQDTKKESETIYGIDKVQNKILDVLEYLEENYSPGLITFICSAEISVFLEQEGFVHNLFKKMDQLYEKGFKLKIGLNSDYQTRYKEKDMSIISQQWVEKHLQNSVESFYYDNSSQKETEDFYIFGRLSDFCSFHVLKNSFYVQGNFYYSKDKMEETEKEISLYLENSNKRFIPHFFESPNKISLTKNEYNKKIFIFQSLPYFGNGEEMFMNGLNLTEKEMDYLKTHFNPLMYSPKNTNNQHYYILDENSIDKALEYSRNQSAELSDIIGRRIYVNTQVLVDQLVKIYKMLEHENNLHVCLLPEMEFKKLKIMMGAWGKELFIGWIPKENSVVCTNYDGVEKMATICNRIWKSIDDELKSKVKTNSRLKVWLQRAKRYGYKVKTIE